MKITHRVAAFTALLGALAQGPSGALADESAIRQIAQVETAGPATKTVAVAPPSGTGFVIPDRGRPTTRLVSAGTRGARAGVSVATIAPESVGRTASGQPTLYWFVSDAHPGDALFTVTDDSTDPLVHVRLPGPHLAGIHRVSLAELGVRLVPGRRYEWSIELLLSALNRPSNPFSSSQLEFVEGGPDVLLAARLRSAGERAVALREAGFWQDSIDALVTDLHSSAPGGVEARRLASALRDVGLDHAASVAADDPTAR